MAQPESGADQATFGDEFESEPADDVFADVECDREDIIGTTSYEGRLYSIEAYEQTAPVNVLTGEKSVPKHSVEQAKAFAEDATREDGGQRVAVPRSTESMAEVKGGPYTATVFYDRKIVCGRVVGKDEYGMAEHRYEGYKRAKGYRAAVASDRYKVRLDEANYETGTVTITVEEVGY